MYSIDKEFEFKTFITKEVEQANSIKAIVCMDVSQDGEYMVSGYLNGFLCLWDISSGKCKKIVTSGLFKSGIIAVKMLKNDKKKFEMLVSESCGLLHYVTLRDGMFTFHQDSRVILETKSPVFTIEILKYSEEDSERDHFEVFYTSKIVGLACLEFIQVMMIEPNEVTLFQIDRPNYLKDYFVPDISFGVGYVPFSEDSNELFIDYLKPQTLFAVSWGKYVSIYSLNAINESGQIKILFTHSGHYVHNATINRMSIIANSILFFFDKENKLKVISTSLVPPGEVTFNYINDPWTPIIDKRYVAELEEGNIIDNNLSFQTHVMDINKCSKATYNNYILNVNKTIYLCTKENFYQGKLLNWEQCLNNLILKSEWVAALTLGLDIYHGTSIALAEIPQDEGIRRATLGKYLMKTIETYVVTSLGSDDNIILIADKTLNDKISKCINICIEFCIEMGMNYYLMSSLMEIFEKKGYGSMFIEKLQPFILCEKFANDKLPLLTIKKIIETYINSKRFLELSQVLVHIGIKSLDNDDIRKECDKHNLITPIIFIYTNSSKKEDYFYPITKMFDVFKVAKELKPFTDFRVVYKNLTNEVENSKQFIGHKMLWFIHLSLKGKKFPNGLIPEEKFERLVIQILLWLVEKDVFIELIGFASLSLFKIFFIYIKDERIKSILLKQVLDSSKTKNLPDLKSSTILEFVVKNSKEYGCATTTHNMYELVAKCAKIPDINKNQLIEAGKYLLKTNSTSTHDLKSISINHTRIDEINKILIDMIESREDFDILDFNNLLTQAEFSPYVLVKIHLLKKVKNYGRCLHEFFQNNLYLQNKENVLFSWIDSTLKELNDTDLYNFELLKEEVLNKLTNLSEISIESVTLLVENWFSNDQNKIISKLNKVKPLQLKYVENLLEKYKENIEYYMTHENYDVQSDEKFKQYSEILILHIKLLCKLSPAKVIINIK